MVETYRDILVSSLSRRGGDLQGLPYAEELSAKNAALVELCRRLPGSPAPRPLVASPRPRGYRTTSRRKVEHKGRTARLVLEGAAGGVDLEPAEHQAIYACLTDVLARSTMGLLVKELNHVIVRGSYSELGVIFNVRELDGAKVRRLRTVVEALRGLPVPLVAAYVFVDPTESEYYLEMERPRTQVAWKTLFGPEHLRLRVRGRALRFHPTAFCQINESLVPAMVDMAERLLAPAGDELLYDLYCGFGLFGLSLADKVAAVRGLDWEGAAIASAQDNAQRDPQPRRLSYRSLAITGEAIASLPAPRPDVVELMLLDPPRSGTAEGVIQALADRGPKRVVHVLCNVDKLGPELVQWQRYGYEATCLEALDMFPGTLHLELMVALEKVAPKAPRSRTPRRGGT